MNSALKSAGRIYRLVHDFRMILEIVQECQLRQVPTNYRVYFLEFLVFL